ncbi:terpene synthase 10 [Daucus carota subsp. sativus]|uniref:terpene synthase 10 n=1 Tax=Daucus carota subsp. sativus TaxID=79200 RepID=UPI0030836884
MALIISTVSLGMSSSATRFMVKPAASLTLLQPPSTKAIHTTSTCCTSNDAALVSRGDACVDDKSIVRRSGNYPPPIWDDDFVQSLASDFKGEICNKYAGDLKERVRMLLNKEDTDNLRKLELVDSVQRLGVGYHFKNEINRILEAVYNNEKWYGKDNLHATSLKFRLLRQHYFKVPQEAFSGFLNESGKFKISLTSDMKGMLYLYEASHHSKTNEKILDEAQLFTTKYMTDYINNKNSKDEELSKLVSRALELPLHWAESRMEARWYIDYFETSMLADDIKDSDLLRFAKLDYNMLQATYQDELKEMSRWWKGIGWAEKLSFARASLIECFYWSLGSNFEPQFQYARSVITAVNAFVTTIDDIYDVYGTLEELELLTKLTKSWDAAELDQLPDFMKICFTDLYNKINEVANVFQREHGVSILPYFQKVWTDLFDAYLVEAKWYHSGYKPSLSEYLDKAWVSISVPVVLTHMYFLKPNSVKEEDLLCLMTCPNVLRHSATILRLADDMATSTHEMERGDNPKSIQCYMNDKGVSADEAREHIKYLITETWKKLNEECAESPMSKPFIENCLNLEKIASCVYLYGDGHGVPGSRDKERLLFLFVHPIPLEL